MSLMTLSLTGRNRLNIVSVSMRKWFTALTLVVATLVGVGGVRAHLAEGACPMAKMPDCCKKAQSADKTPQVAMARLCCKLNCSEPGTTGSNTALSFSISPAMTPTAMVAPKPTRSGEVLLHRFAQSPQLKDSPKYLQHLALLI
jgi:hypothetical protein